MRRPLVADDRRRANVANSEAANSCPLVALQSTIGSSKAERFQSARWAREIGLISMFNETVDFVPILFCITLVDTGFIHYIYLYIVTF